MAPYKSEAQRRKFRELAKQGKIAPSVVREFDNASAGMNLPERVKSESSGNSRRKNKTVRVK